ncbi:hypothetical protein LH464_21280 [Neorhizobium sp. T786]|uniref:hypothetical protein n=1 Tax=Pseudorhizobium xiangyangii TaxID=2883104 RepID=UPI001CFF7BF9|nr:hypothetical protein [Neorhizobium xiangyangii]MCB5205002.1 hypothetical protein [Neorhizobium xiangyangii]
MKLSRIENGVIFDLTPEEVAEHGSAAPPHVLPVTILYPVDLWSRLTETEADQVEAVMLTQSIRVQNIFRSASSYRSDHELWPLLESVAVSLFGEARAAEILSPS